MKALRSSLLAVLTLLAACARPMPTDVTELTYATPYPPSHPFSRADIRWMEHVERESGGTLDIVPMWSGALLSSDMSLEELRHGVADIGLVTPIYTRGGTHLIRIQSGFYSGATTIEAQVALYRCLEASVPQLSRELHGVHVLAVQGGLLPGVVTTNRPVRSLADLRGLRIRAPTELLPVLRELGVDPVNMPVGDPRQGTTPLGAVVDAKTVAHCRSLIEDALAHGAEQLVGGEHDGVLMPAHVIDKVTPGMKLFRDESFGPVVGMIRARDEAHAIELANDTEYGLSAAVFTKDIARGLTIARQIRSGICHVNGPTVHDEAQMPFGGVGASGYGRFGGKAGIDSFTELRWITIETQGGHYPI